MADDKKWIQKAIKRPGAFTAKAKRHGMSVAKFIRYVLSHKDKFSARTIKEAVLARTLRRMAKGRKKEKDVDYSDEKWD